jgi:protein involved in polysaccharide export with SLBB domain
MTRLLTITGLMFLFLATAISAQPVKLSPGDQCLVDLPQWQNYAGTLKTSRDAVEQDAASWKAQAAALRAEVERLTKRVAELEKPK